MDQDSAHMVAASKVPMLKPGEFELWRMRIEQYIQMIDYALWEVIENGATLPKTTIVEGKEQVTPITSAEDKAQRRLEVKARSTLMMGIPNEHQLKFNSIKDAKKLLEAIEKRFGGNEATKKTQRNLLKQQYENFTAPSSEMLDQTFDRLQKLVSQLELLGEKLSQEDVNQKLLRSLSPEWNTHAVVWRNKAELDTMSMDDLITTKNTRRKLTVNRNETIGFDKSKVECYNCHKREHFSRECKAHQEIKTTRIRKAQEVVCLWKYLLPQLWCHVMVLVDMNGVIRPRRATLCTHGKLLILQVLDQSLNKIIECQIVDNCKNGLGYNAVPPPYTGNFMPPTSDLSFIGLDEFVNESVVENSKAKSSKEEPKEVRKNDDAPIIEEWVLDSEEENVSQTKTGKKIVLVLLRKSL
ncbi:ribonuclease H-like domain-containing protein [Tanacetum coccineum]|uniref:Ribonuclease H-like domain-containing protein n=1 Tax=Tanacetum coccineum TaxID=301880 RepID=A0ABQ4WNG8_9ASTR